MNPAMGSGAAQDRPRTDATWDCWSVSGFSDKEKVSILRRLTLGLFWCKFCNKMNVNPLGSFLGKNPKRRSTWESLEWSSNKGKEEQSRP